jgi:hypothetical protein
VEDDVAEGPVDVPPAVVVNDAQFASVKYKAQPLPEKLDWRCAPQRGDLSAAILIYPLAGDRRVVSSAESLYTDTGYG